MSEPREPMHPGKFLDDFMEDRNWDLETMAKKSGLNHKVLRQLLNEEIDVTGEISKSLGLAFSTSGDFFMRLQKRYESNAGLQKEIPKLSAKDLILVALSAGGFNEAFGSVQIQKLMFLIDKEANKRLGVPYFNFEPYKFGPHDEEIYNYLNELENKNFVEKTKQKGIIYFVLKPEGFERGKKILLEMPKYMKNFLISTTKWVISQDFDTLINRIYEDYPEMKVNSVWQS